MSFVPFKGLASEPYLMFGGHVTLASHWLKMEEVALAKLESGDGMNEKDFYDAKVISFPPFLHFEQTNKREEKKHGEKRETSTQTNKEKPFRLPPQPQHTRSTLSPQTLTHHQR